MASLCCALVLLFVVVAVNAQSLNQHRGPWQVVLKVPRGKKASGHSSIVALWESSSSYNDGNIQAMRDFSASSEIYKSSIVNQWTLQSISAVRVSAYKGNIEQAYVVFDAMGKDKNNWFDCGNILSSSYTDIKSLAKLFCSIQGHDNCAKRRFFIHNLYGGCSNDPGWFMFKDYDSSCECSQWDVMSGTPYFYYSGDSTVINMAAGNRQTADTFVISILAWDMVFKGVEGVVPPQGSLRELWKGSELINDGNVASQSLTWAPGLVYKSRIVENWVSYPGFFIESVKYAYYTNGLEVAYTVFDARNQDKNGWFDLGNILYSSYHDIKNYNTMVGSSIDGDGIRRFALHKEHGGCPVDKAWMEILDEPSGSQPCAWDKNVKTRPYFLYSNTGQWALCQSNGQWNSAQFPSAQVMAIFVKGWKLVMKVAEGGNLGGASSVYNLWTGTYTVNENDASALSFAAGSKTFKSSIVDKWNENYISSVRLSMFKGGREVAYVVFNANGADKNSWFDCKRILYSSYNDLSPSSTNNFCSINGHDALLRRFYLNRNYGGCGSDAGWFCTVERTSGCSWEEKTSARPYFLYSDHTGYELSDNMPRADVMAISVDRQDCFPNPCSNNGVCTDEGLTFSCTCSGGWTGDTCSDKNGGWAAWGSWGSCSVTCAAGSKTRSRTCTNPTPIGAGAQCAGSASDSTSCNPGPCPINGNWGAWASWTSCSVTCAAGSKSRTRQCNNPAPAHGGANCGGSGSSTTSCTLIANCPIDGNWGAWTAFGSCSVTCETGTHTKTRSCNNPAPQYNGANCAGSASYTQSCTLPMCPINGNWGAWASWTSCSVTCAAGSKSRTRQCNNPAPAHGGANCGGSGSSTTSCTLIANCPIDGNWGAWTAFGSCSVTCETGTHTKTRSCNNPAPQYNGANCAGSASYTQSCTLPMCPIDGSWTAWGSWGTCSVTCETGSWTRSRTCTNPAPQYGGANCAGAASSTGTCTLPMCPIDGGWTAWGGWGSCTVTCGGGSQTSPRSCTNPAPQYGGANCVGASTKTQTCNTQVCIIDGAWAAWGAWGTCSLTCGGGQYSRSRTCSDPAPANGGLPCSGDSSEYGSCNTQACPTAAPGQYVQLCPSGWFTCQSGQVSCIDGSFACDCSNDCEDGSDETTGYAGCSASVLEECPSGVADVRKSPLEILCLVFGTIVMVMASKLFS